MSINCQKCSSGNCQHCIIRATVDDNVSYQVVEIEENNAEKDNIEYFDCKGCDNCEEDGVICICDGYKCAADTAITDDDDIDNEIDDEKHLEMQYGDGMSEFYENQNEFFGEGEGEGDLDFRASNLEPKPEVTVIPKKILSACTCNANISPDINAVCCGDCNDAIKDTPGFQIFCMQDIKNSDDESSSDICSQYSEDEDYCCYAEDREEDCFDEICDTACETKKCPYNCGCDDCPFMEGPPNECEECTKGCTCSNCECDDCPFYKIKPVKVEDLPCPYNCGCDSCPFRQPKPELPTPKAIQEYPIECCSDTECCCQKLLLKVKEKNDLELLKKVFCNKACPTCTCSSKNKPSSQCDSDKKGNIPLNNICGCKRPECECSDFCKCPPPKKSVPGPKPVHQFGVNKTPCHSSAENDKNSDDNCNTNDTDGCTMCSPFTEGGKEESICNEIAKMKITVKEIKAALNKKEQNKQSRLSTSSPDNKQINIKTEQNNNNNNNDHKVFKEETNTCNYAEDENINLKILGLETKCQTKDNLIAMMIDQLRQHVPQNDIKTMLESFANRPELLDTNIKLEKPSDDNSNIDYDRTKVFDKLTSNDGKPTSESSTVLSSDNPVCMPSPIKIVYCQPCYNNSLLIRWRIYSFYGISGYEVFVDGELSDRIHSPQRNTTLIYNVDPNIEHMITIFPMPNFYDNLNDPCNCATPAKYTYEPKSSSCA